jgi:hypothetical protein
LRGITDAISMSLLDECAALASRISMMQLTLEHRVAILEQEVAAINAKHRNGAQTKPWFDLIG